MKSFKWLAVLILFFGACSKDEEPTRIELDHNYTYTIKVEFIGLWTAQTHPVDFPVNASWGKFTGLTHEDNENILLDVGAEVSAGLKNYAETGDNSSLMNEINQLINGNEAAQINEEGILASVEKKTFTFTTAGQFSRLTLISKISPSPDWIVAIKNIDMDRLAAGGSLYYYPIAYDIGSKSGDTYAATGSATSEKVTIKEDAPLVNAEGNFEQLGRFRISFVSRQE